MLARSTRRSVDDEKFENYRYALFIEGWSCCCVSTVVCMYTNVGTQAGDQSGRLLVRRQSTAK